jgi:uncharacterized protein YqjF (DUF2071 family)
MLQKIKTILEKTEHRPYPMPRSPWLMRQTWEHLLFAHWRVDVNAVRAVVPAELELDLFDGEAWVAVVPFLITDASLRSMPAIPFMSKFPEMNVRTYVRYKGQSGVYFFSLDAANPVAVETARKLFHLPYFNATMKCDTETGGTKYQSLRKDSRGAAGELIMSYRPVGPVTDFSNDSLERWFTERYCLFTVHRGRVYSIEIHHPRWPLQPAAAEFTRNTMIETVGLQALDGAPSLLYAEAIDTIEWNESLRS